jgi:hypothetical protein
VIGWRYSHPAVSRISLVYGRRCQTIHYRKIVSFWTVCFVVDQN